MQHVRSLNTCNAILGRNKELISSHTHILVYLLERNQVVVIYLVKWQDG